MTATVRTAGYLSPSEMFRLDLACQPIRDTWSSFGPYLVGSVMTRRDFRDVDVRLILTDDVYAELITGPNVLTMLNMAFSAYLRDATGLPIDFGIQEQTAANAQHQGSRNPLGLRGLSRWTGDAPLLTTPAPRDESTTDEGNE